MGRTILVAVDDSPTAQGAALWAVNNIARSGDTVHLIAISPPPSYAMTPAAPIASAGAYVQVAALSVNWEQQRKADEEKCRHLLHTVTHQVPESRRQELDLHRHVLPAAGGASGVAESVVAYSKEHKADLVVVGSRGMGAFKSTLMSLVGLGSVSGYLVHHMHCPVAICRGRQQDAEPKSCHKVMMSLDDSEISRKALEWVVHNVLGPQDELHLVCVALPIPYPVSSFVDNHLPQPDVKSWRRRQAAALKQAEAVTHRVLRAAVPAGSTAAAPAAAALLPAAAAEPAAAAAAGKCGGRSGDSAAELLHEARPKVSPSEDFTAPPLSPEEWGDAFSGSRRHTDATVAAAVEHAAGPLQIVSDDAVASEVLEADEWQAAAQDSIHYARDIVAKAVDSAAVQVDKKRIFFKALPPEGGASDVGQSIVHYAKENGMDLVAVGARGMGSWKRAMMSFVGLGSVSDYVVHNVECPVIIFKQQS